MITLALTHAITDAHGQNHLVILVAITDAIDAGNRGDDYAISAFEQTLGGGKPHLLDVLVDCRVFFNEQVARRNVGFRLVVVVIGDKVLDRVLREKLTEFGIQLRRQRLVGRQNQCRAAGPGNDVGHGKGFSGTCYAEQGLKRQSVFKPTDQPGDRLRLVPGGHEGLVQTERTTREGNKLGVFWSF